MRFRSMIAGLLALAATGLCVQGAFAHHSFAMFDNSRSVVLKGVVQRYQWTNPHGYLELKADDGTRYTLELTSINMLSRAGWTSRSVKFGDQVSALVSPLRNGQPGGLLLELTFADGHTIVNPVPNPQNYKRSR